MFGLDGSGGTPGTTRSHRSVRESGFQEWELEAKHRLETEDISSLKGLRAGFEDVQCRLRVIREMMGRMNNGAET